MAGVRGNLSTLRGLAQSLRTLPVSLAHDVAQRGAPALTDEAQEAFSSGETVYGDARPRSKVDGNALSLRRTGRTQDGLRFVATGTIVRCVLPEKYDRYLIGKYGILPVGFLPVGWSRRLAELVATAKVKP